MTLNVAHLWPARYANINPYGKYRFNVEGEFHRKGLRPLRQPDFRISLALFFVQLLSQHQVVHQSTI
jgi:hypothetical protein